MVRNFIGIVDVGAITVVVLNVIPWSTAQYHSVSKVFTSQNEKWKSIDVRDRITSRVIEKYSKR